MPSTGWLRWTAVRSATRTTAPRRPTGSFTYTVTDGTDTATVLVTITVAPVTDLPVLLLIAVALGVGLLTSVAVLAMWIRRTKEAG